ncbi:hypothetical protein [Brachyspira hyodysenteriae]|nr:hypothetical protein [Brachyspira hyodysenteriae]MCZ9901761.1 hypothetical protein [Brachyspira hyodysenteriae]
MLLDSSSFRLFKVSFSSSKNLFCSSLTPSNLEFKLSISFLFSSVLFSN